MAGSYTKAAALPQPNHRLCDSPLPPHSTAAAAVVGAMSQHAKVTVHVIEVRELPGRGSTMLCDPFVRVTVNGVSKQTPIRYHQTSAVFDEYFTFSDLVFSQEDYNKASIRVEVFDAKVFFRNELIGQSLFGLASIRALASHEIFQQWVELENPRSTGAGNGFVRVSISVVGDSDRPTGHSTTGHFNKTLKEIQLAAPSSAIGQILGNPVLAEKRRGYNFQIKVFRAEHLLSEGNTFVMVRFGGISTKTPIKPKSKSPDWNFQLTMAVFTPRYSDAVEVELWSSGAFSETMIGSVTLRFSEILAYYYPPSWFNLYGPSSDEVGGWLDLIGGQIMSPNKRWNPPRIWVDALWHFQLHLLNFPNLMNDYVSQTRVQKLVDMQYGLMYSRH
ncbi:hypothetical protein BASA81_002506 [Batrachochytrium salamandrivorans]|nr:hypothetical protein BASA81_002506 [Batrachochytrium salamandrivorans]